MKAFSMIRFDPHYRREAFNAGLEACGYQVHGHPREAPNRDDVLVIWNRYGPWGEAAARFDHAGARVICAENGVLGRDWQEKNKWYSIALDIPAAYGGRFPASGPERWKSWGVNLCEWRKEGKEVIVLAQRGIGPAGHAQPHGWHIKTAERLRTMTDRPVRIREHPGERAAIPVEADVQNAFCVVTWASGAALKAVIAGVPVFFGCPQWIGAGAGQQIGKTIEYPYLQGREPMLERLAWSTWNTKEIATGEPFRRLLTSASSISMGTTAAR